MIMQNVDLFYNESPEKKSPAGGESHVFEDLVIKNTQWQIAVFKPTDEGFEFSWSNKSFDDVFHYSAAKAKSLNFKVFRNFQRCVHEKTPTLSLLDLLQGHLDSKED